MVKYFLVQLFLWITVALLAADVIAAPHITVNLKRNVIVEDESFTVEFKVSDSGKIADPNWAPLQRDFKILGENKSYSFQSINGRQQSLTTWSLELTPNRSGNLVLPSISFNKLTSKPQKIQVKPRSSVKQLGPEDIYIEVSAEPSDPYVQQQVQFVFKVFMAKNLRGNITQPSFKGNVAMEPLPEKNYRVNRQGKNYQVYERSYMLYPQASGKVEINPVALTGQYIENGRRFSVNKRSKLIRLNVRPVAAGFVGNFWLPASDLQLQQQWSDDLAQWVQGEPLTWTIKLVGKNLLASQLPAIEIPQLAGFNVYTDAKPSLQTVPGNSSLRGERTQKFVFIPTQSGEHTLPEIKIPWWNTRTDQQEYAVLQKKKVQIEPGTLSQLVMESPVPLSPQEAGLTTNAANTVDYMWVWLSGVLGCGWLITLILIVRKRLLAYTMQRRLRQSRSAELKKSCKRVQSACEAQDTKAVRDALLQWACIVWQRHPPRSLGEIMARCSPGLQSRIQAFDQAVYGHGEWDANSLWQAVLHEPLDKATPTEEPGSSLEPLYKSAKSTS